MKLVGDSNFNFFALSQSFFNILSLFIGKLNTTSDVIGGRFIKTPQRNHRCQNIDIHNNIIARRAK